MVVYQAVRLQVASKIFYKDLSSYSKLNLIFANYSLTKDKQNFKIITPKLLLYL